MTFTKQQLIFIGVAGLIGLLILLVFLGVLPGKKASRSQIITLYVWGVGDENDEVFWSRVASRYRQDHPNVRLNYTNLSPLSYEKDLLNALAAGRGPDVFMISNSWLWKHSDKIAPLPQNLIKPADVDRLFPRVVAEDFVRENQVYALPLSLDTLALAYNRDVFDRKGVALPPTTWDEFNALIPRLRQIKKGELIFPAASIGGSMASVPNAPYIFNLLLVEQRELQQAGASDITLDSSVGGEALRFYTSFSDPKSPAYTWNDSFRPSIETFAQGETAMIFIFQSEVPAIRDINPFLNFRLQPVPQFVPDRPAAVANYWGLAVSNKSGAREAAWDLVMFVSTDKTNALGYTKLTGRPPALRSLINEYLDDPELGLFVRQALVARSWLPIEDSSVKEIINRMITSVMRGEDVGEPLQRASAELAQLLSPQPQ
jgi:ABC-type glycerol-3-phosphate transport system substrate-binding protein